MDLDVVALRRDADNYDRGQRQAAERAAIDARTSEAGDAVRRVTGQTATPTQQLFIADVVRLSLAAPAVTIRWVTDEHSRAARRVPTDNGVSNRSERTIIVWPPDTEAHYLTIIHELGHQRSPLCADALEREMDAWAWASTHGAYWSRTMAEDAIKALDSYVEAAVASRTTSAVQLHRVDEFVRTLRAVPARPVTDKALAKFCRQQLDDALRGRLCAGRLCGGRQPARHADRGQWLCDTCFEDRRLDAECEALRHRVKHDRAHPPPEVCANCGARVQPFFKRRDARRLPCCGSDPCVRALDLDFRAHDLRADHARAHQGVPTS